jgi:tetratricopeptide (TPR) repeat protein
LNWFKRSVDLYDGFDPVQVARTNVKIASCYSFLDQSHDAVELLEASVSFLKKTSEVNSLADAYEGLGVVKMIRGEIDTAHYHYQRALEAAKNSSPVIAGNAQYGIARVETTRAIVMGNRSLQYDNSMQIAFRLYDEGGSSIGKANCNLVRGFMKIAKRPLGNAIEWKGCLNRAIDWLKSARELYEHAENALGQALCEEILGDLYACLRLNDQAIEHRDRAWALFPRTSRADYNESRKDRMRLEHMLIQTGYSRLLLVQYL